MTLYLDSHEALDLYLSLSQAVDCQMMALNEGGRADVFWLGYGGKSYSCEHKQVGEVLGGLDDIEELLSRQYPYTDQLYLVIEGILLPSGHAHAQTLGWSQDGNMAFRQGRKGQANRSTPYDFSYSGYISWLESLEESA